MLRPLAALTCAFALVPAAASAATSVSRSGPTIAITGDDGPNVVVADDDYVGGYPAIVVQDPSGGPIVAGGECVQATASRAVCGTPALGVSLTVALGGGDDTFRDDISQADMRLDLDAGPGNDTIVGSMNGDALRGGDGNDRISAMSGDDTVDGGAGDDTLLGMSGNDTLVGGAGRDTLNGDGRTVDVTSVAYGNDTIDARDGERDTVACELGGDVVSADALDVVEGDCEQVDRAAAAAPGGSAGGLSVSLSGIRMPSLKAALGGAAIRMRVTFSAPCTAAVGLVVPRASARRLGLGAKDTVIASDTASAQAGTFSASVTLASRYRSKLKRAKRVSAALGVVCVGADGTQVQDGARVTLR